MKTCFCIIAKGDVPIYELQMSVGSAKNHKDELNHFVIHSALDSVEQRVWTTNSMYLKVVDNFNELTISAFVSAAYVKFVLLHDHRMDDNSIKAFFLEVYELYVKVILNPFYSKHMPIQDKGFDEKVRFLAERHWGVK